MARVTDELGAIVLGTESATNSILESAEAVDELAGNLAARLSGEEGDMARRIGERTIAIFEACNFQDITGQRISKVVNAMRFVEERVGQMIEIWGGHERFKDVPTAPSPDREGDRALLNGPGLEADGDTRSQDDIDAYFR
jgi:chemotaxis protein CheZ